MVIWHTVHSWEVKNEKKCHLPSLFSPRQALLLSAAKKGHALVLWWTSTHSWTRPTCMMLDTYGLSLSRVQDSLFYDGIWGFRVWDIALDTHSYIQWAVTHTSTLELRWQHSAFPSRVWTMCTDAVGAEGHKKQKSYMQAFDRSASTFARREMMI